jgi:hypothetical protein
MRLHVTADERGSVLVITVVVLATLLVLAAYAIDEGIWFVHHGHLQTEADAAALAGAQNFQYPCTAGGAMDEQIATTVHRYDGTKVSSGGYNEQVPVTPTPATIYSPTQHNLISQINQPNFINQSQPNDSGLTGSPCTDAAIDVKLSETNLASFFPFVSPKYITARARVSIEKLTSVGSGLSPLAEPLPTPNAMTAYLIDEGNKNAVLATVKLLPVPETNNTSWTATAVPFTFNATGPIGMEIAENGGSGTVPCDNTNGDSCYDTADSPNLGITYTRVWSHSATPGQPASANPAPPQVDDVSFDPTTTTCPSKSGTFSNFISTSASCTVTLKIANVVFATGTGAPPINCENAGLTVTVGSGSPQTLTCPTGTSLNGQTWTSGPITVTPSSNATNITLGWSLKTGNLPSEASGGTGGKTPTCTNSKPCTGSFGVVQRIFSGAYDSQSATSSHSGGVLAASLTDPSSGESEIQSTPKSTTAKAVAIHVNVLSFQGSQEIGSPPVELSFGGNQANGSVSCPGLSAGQPQLEGAIVSGCTQPFQLNKDFSSNPCATTTSPLDCLPENPGNGKLDKVLDDAMNTKINGSKNAECKAFNYWAKGNTVPQLLNESPHDPRLLTLFTTDYGALGNGRNEVPIRAIADFYVTGWQGDPCIGQAYRPPTANELASTGDESPLASANGGDPAGVLLGHFVQYTELSSNGKGEGQCVQSTSLGNCIAVLTK